MQAVGHCLLRAKKMNLGMSVKFDNSLIPTKILIEETSNIKCRSSLISLHFNVQEKCAVVVYLI